METSKLTLSLPGWLGEILNAGSIEIQSVEERMRFVIGLSQKNVEQETGGPFAAAIFEVDTGVLISAGVNIVVASNCSLAHAEMVAISFAQKALDTFDLGAKHLPACQLVTSCQPCAMCLGAIPWSGVRQVICGATDSDARQAGFDEGVKPQNWQASLLDRGIEVVCDVLQPEAAAVFDMYEDQGGRVYNGS
jgi:tRNA(Arg) A34 adenosine deaminase TadA